MVKRRVPEVSEKQGDWSGMVRGGGNAMQSEGEGVGRGRVGLVEGKAGGLVETSGECWLGSAAAAALALFNGPAVILGGSPADLEGGA